MAFPTCSFAANIAPSAFTAPVNARYIRYTGYGSNANAWNSLKEIELIGP